MHKGTEGFCDQPVCRGASADQRRTAGFHRGMVSIPAVARSCTYRDHLPIDHSGICDTGDDRALPVMSAERKESGSVIFA